MAGSNAKILSNKKNIFLINTLQHNPFGKVSHLIFCFNSSPSNLICTDDFSFALKVMRGAFESPKLLRIEILDYFGIFFMCTSFKKNREI